MALDDREFGRLASLLQRRQLDKKDLLLRPGDVCRFEGFVDAGCLRVFAASHHGADHVLYFAPEDWWVADIESFTCASPAERDRRARADHRALHRPPNKERLYTEIPKFERLFRIMSQRALVALQHRLIASMDQTAEQRYLAFVRQYPALHGRIPQHQIAAYLGVCPGLLSRIRRRRLAS